MIVQVAGLRLLPPSARKPKRIKEACRRTLKNEKADGFGELNIVFLGRKEMRALNKRYLVHDYDTDVIAFPYASPAAVGRGRDKPFGDVFISVHQAKIQAEELGHPLLTEVLTLVIHGTLHLLGYRDDTPRRKAAMFRAQDRLLRAL